MRIQRSTLVVSNRQRYVGDVDYAPASSHQAVLASEDLLPRRSNFVLDAGTVVGMNRVDEQEWTSYAILLGVPEDRADLGAHAQWSAALTGSVDVRYDRELLDKRVVLRLRFA